MIFIGTDIVPIFRIEKMIDEKGNRFLNRIFTKKEQNICNEKANPPIHYSGKYAAKEAVKKALLSSKTIENISLKSIEINNDYLGEPIINVKYKNIRHNKLKVSISHAGEYAIATAILEI